MKHILLALGILACIAGSVAVEAKPYENDAQRQATQKHRHAEKVLIKAIKAYCKTDRLHPVCSVTLNTVDNKAMQAYLSDFDKDEELAQVYQIFLKPIPCSTDTDCVERNPWIQE